MDVPASGSRPRAEVARAEVTMLRAVGPAAERQAADERHRRRDAAMKAHLAARDAARRNMDGVKLPRRLQRQAFKEYMDFAFPRDPRLVAIEAKYSAPAAAEMPYSEEELKLLPVRAAQLPDSQRRSGAKEFLAQ